MPRSGHLLDPLLLILVRLPGGVDQAGCRVAGRLCTWTGSLAAAAKFVRQARFASSIRLAII